MADYGPWRTLHLLANYVATGKTLDYRRHPIKATKIPSVGEKHFSVLSKSSATKPQRAI